MPPLRRAASAAEAPQPLAPQPPPLTVVPRTLLRQASAPVAGRVDRAAGKAAALRQLAATFRDGLISVEERGEMKDLLLRCDAFATGVTR